MDLQRSKPVTAGPAGALAEQPVSMAQETSEPASDEFESGGKSVAPEIAETDVKMEQPVFKPGMRDRRGL